MSYQYFDGFPIAGSTQKILVTFASETDLDALARAQAIVESCESDLDQLQICGCRGAKQFCHRSKNPVSQISHGLS